MHYITRVLLILVLFFSYNLNAGALTIDTPVNNFWVGTGWGSLQTKIKYLSEDQSEYLVGYIEYKDDQRLLKDSEGNVKLIAEVYPSEDSKYSRVLLFKTSDGNPVGIFYLYNNYLGFKYEYVSLSGEKLFFTHVYFPKHSYEDYFLVKERILSQNPRNSFKFMRLANVSDISIFDSNPTLWLEFVMIKSFFWAAL
ncbi:MAG: hypothetical protein WC222_00855 [Parachlamydiales bacterium]|jgi:hypothetical protein